MIAVVVAGVIALHGLRLCCEAAANRTLASSPAPSWRSAPFFVGATMLLASIAVPSMELFDSRLAGTTLAGLDDAFGGSVLLGLSTTLACAAAVAIAAFALARWILSRRDRIIAAIVGIVRSRLQACAGMRRSRSFADVPICLRSLSALRRGKRAPRVMPFAILRQQTPIARASMLPILVAACCLIGGNVHTPAGAPIAQAQLTFRGPKSTVVSTDTKGDFSVVVPAGRYDLTVVAKGYAAVTVSTGELNDGARISVVLEPSDTPKLRTIGQVTVNGGFTLNRNVIPEMDVSRAQMDALGYTEVLQALQQVPSAIIQHPDSGAPTAPEVVSLRGPDPSEAMVTLDGQQLNDGNTGDIDLSQFAVPAFNSVNVTEGLGPTDLEGSNTFGGAVNFVSLRPTQEDHFNLSTSAGSYGTTQSWLNATGTIGKLGYALAGDNFAQTGQVNEYDWVVPSNNLPIYCGLATKTKTPNCPFHTHLGSSIAARLGLVNLDYNFSQRADVGFRVFTLGDERDESGALNGIAGNPTCVFSGPGPACAFSPSGSDSPNEIANPVYGDHVGPGSATFAQGIRAYDAYSRSPLGSGTLSADFTATTTTSTSSAERSRRTTSPISTHATTRGFRGAGPLTRASLLSVATRAKRRSPAPASKARCHRASTRISFAARSSSATTSGFQAGYTTPITPPSATR